LTDPSGKFAFVPLLIIAGGGAIIGGAASGILYAISHPCENLLNSASFWRAVGAGAVGGFMAGLLPIGGSLGAAVIWGMVGGASSATAAQLFVNLTTPGASWDDDLIGAAITGGVAGGIFGGVGYGVRQLLTPKAIGWTGKIGENVLKKMGGESQVRFSTSHGDRYVDQLVRGVAHESKVGYTTLTQDIQQQIAKDVELMATREVKQVVWHFFTSPVTGQGGPSGPLEQALIDAGIQIITH
jgi:filamentous hemagglutinin